MIIGITGNSGVGKTEVSKVLAKRLNADIINADKIARKLAKPGQIYYKKILELFGNEILTDNCLNRHKIADIIFTDSIKREQLNSLTYKYVVDEIKTRVKLEKTNKNVVLDVPLLFESGLDKICDITIAILADEDVKIDRICKRDNISNNTAVTRLKAQKDNKYYEARADYVINNNGKIEEIDLEELCIKIGKN